MSSTTLAIIVIAIMMLFSFGCISSNENMVTPVKIPTDSQTSTPTPTPTQTTKSTLSESQKKIIMIEKILDEYSQNHIYMSDDVFDCDNMAQDVWNIFKAKGINSKLVLGNVDHFGPLTLDYINHAWLIVEISPEEWIAIETTGGFVVYFEDNDRYYKGYFFSNPKNYRDFLDLYEDYNYQYADYENERQYYNQLVEQYNSANYYEQIQLESALIVTRNNVEIKERRASETWIKIETILEYG